MVPKKTVATATSSVPSYVKPKANLPLSDRCGLVFPVARVRRFLKHTVKANRVALTASIAITAALELLCKELLDISAEQTKCSSRQRIQPTDIESALKSDVEMQELVGIDTNIYDSREIERRRRKRRLLAKHN